MAIWKDWRLLAAATFALIGITVAIIGGFGLWGVPPPGTPIAENLNQVHATAHFTWTLPSGWRSELWQGEQIKQKAEALPSAQQPLLELFITRFAPATSLLVGYPSIVPNVASNASTTTQIEEHHLFAFSLARQGLRLPQVVDVLTQRLQSQPDIAALQSSIGQADRPDGQPAARIRYQLRDPATTKQTDVALALLINPIADALIFVMEVDPAPEEDKIIDQVVAGIRW